MAIEVKRELEEKFQELKTVIDRYKNMEGPLMPIMHKAQEIFGYLPLEVQNFIAEELDIPLTDVYGVATFYSHFTLQPQGKYTINICLGTACYVKGAQKVLDKLKEELKINEGETTPDGKFTIDATRCLGACGLAPVMMINGEVYGRLVPDDVPKILKRYMND
ncbi:NADH-quinone oxidoreductase subunit NuoE [Mahella australiensis]|jgi:NADH-quinone oxidoreductase E subunit|uniref:NAD(P)-dependent iron-only hydrogenase diaphorase component iron-sulfur protein n=1 Tax=Mahella australiensis (strain DSM 15567 / CIP 107919 / 50-1 BON) TaxID=697281 RepID=F3ZW64_MAHA5|nr:NADH-quinone oxidoreductase subunit NuoE [Mahella australiensis]AEE96444.1 NAD(P)-dependent iron-only hydrogenase diaphorase component iron-sulfur protein [Mahella australiensis 50-1 BON]MDK2902369.1 NADP-reducing hydrogenase subunit HndA [Clostridiales bacterium]